MKVGDLVKIVEKRYPSHWSLPSVGLVIAEPWVEEDPFDELETFIMVSVAFPQNTSNYLADNLEVVSES